MNQLTYPAHRHLFVNILDILFDDIRTRALLSRVCRQWHYLVRNHDPAWREKMTVIQRHIQELNQHLYKAALYGHPDMVQLFISRGATNWEKLPDQSLRITIPQQNFPIITKFHHQSQNGQSGRPA